ncbi:MAG: hypothetical protein N3A38_14960 [Planctomycetota bacterium]|nr:hypothetical protein [Planctomycetota bacterium]
MALTDERKAALFEVLEIPVVPKIARVLPPDGPGLTAFVEEQTVAAAQACELVEARLAELTAAQEARLAELLDAWIEIGTDSTRVDAGTIGGLSGVSYDPDREREEIRRRVQLIVPFLRYADELVRRRSNSTTIPILR